MDFLAELLGKLSSFLLKLPCETGFIFNLRVKGLHRELVLLEESGCGLKLTVNIGQIVLDSYHLGVHCLSLLQTALQVVGIPYLLKGLLIVSELLALSFDGQVEGRHHVSHVVELLNQKSLSLLIWEPTKRLKEPLVA